MTKSLDNSEFLTAHVRICDLIDRFEKYAREKYLLSSYQEAEARKDFIDPMFKALGWDVDHERQHNPYEQEVKVERGLSVHDARNQKRADYAFYLAPSFREVRFYVEAKKPSVDLNRSVDAHFQTLRYGYSANTPLAVLTDFEQVRVLDCRRRPHPENALDQTYRSWHYTDFRDSGSFAEFYWLFSRQAHADGSYQRHIETLPKAKGGAKQRGLFKGGYQPVDESFLEVLSEHRESLAKAFKKANSTLDSESLTEIVQRTLDRLVFLRFLEDKQIETDIRLSDFGKGRGAWADFRTASQRLDSIYNGIVFKKLPVLDDIDFDVDDDIFADIRDNLSSENSPFNFDAIPIHILGSIYERFLGSVIRATEKRVVVEQKPEVRKAGGVYYTPEYIVRYIVAQTVGKKIEGKSPAEVAKLRFADIACGSGSFLLGIYDELLRYHADWYNRKENDKQAKKDGCVKTEEDHWRLSLAQRRSILLNSVYGVDLDPQAVEVAQLSLFLKLLEDESATTTNQYQRQLDFARDPKLKKLLPDLSSNIKCGNSLIGWDVAGLAGLDTHDENRLNPINYEDEFPSVMKAGGFDAIVGNPPYVRQEGIKEIKAYLQKSYECFSGTADLYAYFMERGLKLLREDGFYSIIVSSSFLRANFAENLRATLKKHAAVIRLVDFGGLAVFADAKDTYVCIPVMQRATQPARIEICKVTSLDARMVDEDMAKVDYTVPHDRFDRAAWSLSSDETASLFAKLVDSNSIPLGAYLKEGRTYRGIITGLNEAFVVDSEDRMTIVGRDASAAKFLHPVRGGEDCRDYLIRPGSNWIVVLPCGSTREAMKSSEKVSEASAWKWLKSKHPSLAEHLEPFAAAARKRQDKGEYWWELRPCDYYSVFENPKIVFPDICKNPRFCYDDSGRYFTNTAYMLSTGDKYLLGILNSRVFWFAIANISIPFGMRAGEYRYRMFYQYMEQVPIRRIDPNSREDMKKHDAIVLNVDALLLAKQQEHVASGSARTVAERKCRALEAEVNRLVYQLYDLSDEEVALVEA